MPTIQTIALVGNGPYVPAVDLMPQYDVVVALDGGYRHCQQLDIAATIVLGDGDSAPETAPLLQLTDQTTTDLQKGLAWVAEHYAPPYSLDLFSVTSAERLDHTLNAIQLANRYPEIRHIYTPYQRIQIVRSQVELNLPTGTHLSILPVEVAATISLTGCHWSGETITLDPQSSGISNVTTGEPIVITVKSGTVLVINAHVWTKQ